MFFPKIQEVFAKMIAGGDLLGVSMCFVEHGIIIKTPDGQEFGITPDMEFDQMQDICKQASSALFGEGAKNGE